MSKSKKYQRRVVNVISTDSLGKFIFEFRESTETDIYTVHTIVTDWESAAPAVSKFMHGGDVDMSGALL